jgi:hypothetical protein
MTGAIIPKRFLEIPISKSQIPNKFQTPNLQITQPAPHPSPLPWRLCRNLSVSLRATGGSVAISLFSIYYEIASVVKLPRNDIATQSPEGRGMG